MELQGESVRLSPKYFLDDDWENPELIQPAGVSTLAIGDGSEPSLEEEGLREWIESIRIEVSKAAITTKLSSDDANDYLKTELGMNIIVPRGSIEKLRFKIVLTGGKESDEIIAIDGFPKDMIGKKFIIDGKIQLGITKVFKFVPVVGEAISDLLDIQLNPWEFRIGGLKKVNVDFSGGLTQEPEWYFKEDGFQNDLRVALTIRKPKSLGTVNGKVTAAWVYDPGIFRKAVVRSDSKTVKIY